MKHHGALSPSTSPPFFSLHTGGAGGAGLDFELKMHEVRGTEFGFRGFERCCGYKRVIKRDNKTMEAII